MFFGFSFSKPATKTPPRKRALLLVDIQNDFLPPNGSLAVPDGRSILPTAYKLMDEHSWDMVIASMDFHPPGHVSFASRWGQEPFTSTKVPAHHTKPDEKIEQALWPDHCVQGSEGGKLEAGVQTRLDRLARAGKTTVQIIRKGADPEVDSYSAFADNVYSSFTPLAKILHSNSIESLVIVGLATDYCVRATVTDARKFNFDTVVVKEGVSAVDPKMEQTVLDELAQWGAVISSIDNLQL